jgi:lysophospholipase L1-like esterase
VWALNATGLFKAAIIADSLGGGAGSVRRKATVPEIACSQLGIDYVWNISAGGTGFINGGGDGLPFQSRIDADLIKTDPDLIILFGGYNDRSYTLAAIQAAAETAIAKILADHPKAALFVVGSWTPGTPDSAIVTANNAVKAAAATYDVPFVDLLDPTGASVTAANYDAALTYRTGEPVLQGGVLYIAQATSTAIAFNIANWRAASVIFGTGKSGTPAGNGNADVATSSDAVHPTIPGAKLVGTLIARRIYELAYQRVEAAEANSH